MILDTISNIGNYLTCHQQFYDVFSFMKSTNLGELKNGKHPINDKGAFASVNEYETKVESDCFIECHKKYIDIQIISKGEELIGYCPVNTCISQPYIDEKDLQKLEGEVSYFTLTPDMFAIFFPHDGHMPCVRKGDSTSVVKKIVFKIPL